MGEDAAGTVTIAGYHAGSECSTAGAGRPGDVERALTAWYRSTEVDTRSRWFVTLWPMAFSFHWLERQAFESWPILLAGAPCVIWPESIQAFGAFLVVGTAWASLDLPAAANHLVLGMLVNIALLGGLVIQALRAKKDVPAALEAARGAIGWTLVVMYAFAIFHKLNTSFFDPRVSCAGVELQRLLALHGVSVGRISPGGATLAAMLALSFEAIILGALVVPSARRWAILAGVAFHGVLSGAQFYDFAGFVLAIYVLLAPAEAFGHVPAPERARRIALAGWGLHAVVAFAERLTGAPLDPTGPGWHTAKLVTWMIAVMALLLPLLRALFRPATAPPAADPWRLRPIALVTIPALAFLNGATSYLGLKTVANFSMFSNLRTEEGKTNHLLPGVLALEATDWMRDTVDVLEIEGPGDDARLSAGVRLRGGREWLQRQTRWSRSLPARVPWLELRRAVLLWRDSGLAPLRIRYERGGAIRDVPDATRDPELTASLSWWTRKLVAFRAIDRSGAARCRW